ncbi:MULTISPECIES: hypothetical protein [Pseudomonas]|uniref:Uncharacterized protein n=2 Tax=Pseudomonadaceae TaxID=135621 RepID=A0A0D0JES6_9PSED|nr:MULTISPECIES: hypothetical protein [Pseudomonas]KIQ04470.1 hypothetical protein RU08_05905 [Pseudomonas fulva]MCW2293228.1 hypothetical protein [Pseudomonas sp. BIGb0408]NYH72201.1 hypothetical protein [Pseudomonas flavescens]
MTNLHCRVIRFPKRQSPIPQKPFPAVDLQGEAELRASLVCDLFDEVIKKKDEPQDSMQIHVAALFAKDLVEEMVVLYRRALCEDPGGEIHN